MIRDGSRCAPLFCSFSVSGYSSFSFSGTQKDPGYEPSPNFAYLARADNSLLPHHFDPEPGPGIGPVTLLSGVGNRQGIGRLLSSQSPEKP